MLARNACGVGAALDSDDAPLGRLQATPATKTSSTAEPIERSPAMFISPFSWQAVIHCPSGGRDDLTRKRMEPAGSGATWTGSPKGVFAGRKHHKPQQAVLERKTRQREFFHGLPVCFGSMVALSACSG